MAFRTQKISQMTPKGSDLEATDLIEVSTIESGSYVTRSITGQELIDAIPAPSVDWGDIGGTLSDQTDLNTALSGKVPTSRTLTINGTTQDLSADRTFTISTGITIGTTAITSGTVGRVLFEGTGNVVQESSSFTYDDTLKVFTITGPIGSVLQHTALTNYNGLGGFQLNVSGGTERGFFKLNPTTGEVRIGATGSGYFPTFYAQGVEAMRIFASTRNVGINTTTDTGFRFDVNGTARVQSGFQANGNVIFGTSNGFYWDSATQRLGIGTSTPQAFLHFNNATGEKIRMETSGTLSNFISIYNSGVSLGYIGKANSTTDLYYMNSSAANLILGTNNLERLRIKSTGVINLSSVPTSSAGLSAGDIWNDAGTLKIV